MLRYAGCFSLLQTQQHFGSYLDYCSGAYGAATQGAAYAERHGYAPLYPPLPLGAMPATGAALAVSPCGAAMQKYQLLPPTAAAGILCQFLLLCFFSFI